jgi:hypothetical protein
VIVATIRFATGIVEIANVAEEDPAGIPTDDGIVVIELLVVKLTTRPPAGAPPFSVTMPVADVPP